MEHYIEQHCRAIATAAGGLLLKLSPVACAGIPDRMLLLPGGRVIFIEFKQPGRYLKPLQRFWRDWLVKRGFRFETCRSSAEFRELVLSCKIQSDQSIEE
jgi:VRR-NUC domain